MKRLEYSSGPGTRFYPGRLLPVRNADVGVASFVEPTDELQVGQFPERVVFVIAEGATLGPAGVDRDRQLRTQ